MIQSNELRIGNYVSDIHASNSFMAQVRKLDYDRCYYGLFHFSYNDLKPIPLTEEILLKCGFEKIGGTIYKNIGSIEIGKMNNRFYIQIGIENITLKLHFLHQLQNLYFALTNEELTFNNEL